MKLTVLLGIACLGMVAAQSIQISQEGKSDYCIVVPDGAAPVLKTAAAELGRYLKEVTKAELPIVVEAERPTGKPAFVIGPAKAASAVFSDPTFAKGKPDEIAIKFKGTDIYLNGRMPRGPLYATYTFLEDYVGVNWWTLEEHDSPDKPTLVVSAKDHEYAPKLISRETFYGGTHNQVFASYMKCNGHYSRIKEEYGRSFTIIGFCHTFNQFLPPSKFFSEHPEWYSEIKGKRSDKAQLCLTNDEMKAEFIKVCLEQIRKNPTAEMISVSQNDLKDGRCECAKCKAIEEVEGSASGPLLRFVNDVAAEIAKEYPDIWVDTLAYHYTRQAPKVTRPANNVVIRLCSIEMDFSKPLETGETNASFRKDIEDWSAIAPNLFVWNYVTNFANYLLPQPNWRGLVPDIRFFLKHHAIGLFEQGDAGCKVGDFVRPRQWIIAHLLWNPDLDEKELTRKFFNGYYGPAGMHLLKYIDYLCDCVEQSNFYLRCFNNDVFGWFKPEQVEEAMRLYAVAEEAVKGNEVFATRVRRERIPLDLVRIMYAIKQANLYRLKVKQTPEARQEILDLADEFVELTKKAGNWREGIKFADYATNLKDALETLYGSGYVPEICKGKPLDSWDFFPVGSYRIYKEGKWAKRVDDPAAIRKRAIRMPNDHFQWATQANVSIDQYDATKKWKIVARVRCEGNATDGEALHFGIYGTGLFHCKQEVKVSECKGKDYALIESRPFTIKELQGKETCIWFAPVQHPADELEAVYIDEVILMQAE
ncbi:MAG: DUF4838 domain-containing protein [Victivallales bacterium]|nr:DUF4838 domain-containing protein [Victivallales bacterium]